MRKIFLFCFLIICCGTISAQGIINNGAKIYIAEGAFVHGGNFTNEYSGTSPEIELNGTLELEGNWINNSGSGNIFINIEETPNGLLSCISDYDILLGGNTFTSFENVNFNAPNITLNISDNEIYGIMTIDGVLDLNSNKIILRNNSEDAILYKSGFIKSESNPDEGLGEIEWIISDAEGVFSVPFGLGNTEKDLNVSLEITSAGTIPGSIIFATYPTNSENLPLPDNVSLSDLTAQNTADRYWKIEPNFSSKPEISLTLNYTNQDINSINNPDINVDSLNIFRYNSDTNTWTDYIPGNPEISINSITINNIPSENFLKWWTLADLKTEIPEIPLVIPNGITPNNDGYNDTWVIEGCTGCKVYIYNRWGDEVFQSNNYNNDWQAKNSPSGAFYYILILPDSTQKNGTVNVLK